MEDRVKTYTKVEKSGNMAENSQKNSDIDRIGSLKAKYNPANLDQGKDRLLNSMPVTKNQWMKSNEDD